MILGWREMGEVEMGRDTAERLEITPEMLAAADEVFRRNFIDQWEMSTIHRLNAFYTELLSAALLARQLT